MFGQQTLRKHIVGMTHTSLCSDGVSREPLQGDLDTVNEEGLRRKYHFCTENVFYYIMTV